MFAKMPRLLLTACIICPSLSRALGLGEIHLNSALNEPLRAEIDLIAASPEELTALRASIADRDAFTRYGIDRPPFVSSLTFKVGKGKDGHNVLQVRSADSIPEPFVTFLVEVNWARGRLMREYTVLLDPPVYAPAETVGTSAPVTMAASSPVAPTASPPLPAASSTPAAAASAPVAPRQQATSPSSGSTMRATRPAHAAPVQAEPDQAGPGSYRAVGGDTLSKIARRMGGGAPAQIDQTMIAVFRANPDAFDGNINILRRGAILRLPGADEIAALNQREAVNEVARQMNAWRSGAGAAASSGQLRLVTPKVPGAAPGTGTASSAANADVAALKDRVKDLESQLAESHRLIDIRSAELAALQHKLAAASAIAPTQGAAPAAKPVTPPPAPVATPAQEATPPAAVAPPTTEPAPAVAPTPAVKPPVPTAAPAANGSGSWLDWIANNWQVPAVLIAALLAALGITAFMRRKRDETDELTALAGSTRPGGDQSAMQYSGARKANESFLVEESGVHKSPEFAAAPDKVTGDTVETKLSPDDTMSSENPVSIDQGDPLAEADFHMAYGLYDQAADLVRIALEHEPERRDLQMKLLEIYFVWGNAEQFLQTAKLLESTRDRAPAGEWDKIVIMGKQICPDEPMFSKASAGGRGATALVDLNLEGGENRVDIELFGEPQGERSRLDHTLAQEGEAATQTGESANVQSGGLDFMLDAPERGADESPTHEAPSRDEPTVESEQMYFGDAAAGGAGAIHDRIAAKSGTAQAEQTAEVAIDDLGLDLDGLEATDTPSITGSGLEQTDHAVAGLETTNHPGEAPTVVAGMDERSRRIISETESHAHDGDMTELERELEASFIAELAATHDEIKVPAIASESAPTVQMPVAFDPNATAEIKRMPVSDASRTEVFNIDSTSKMRSITADGIDLDLDRLTTELSAVSDTQLGPLAADELFSKEIFEDSQRVGPVNLDLNESANSPDAIDTVKTRNVDGKSPGSDVPADEFEPVTMSEVGTKLDLARAYMDMGDPEGARSILEEVAQEGSASQKQEAKRLLQSLPG
jgi:pilus assembly protein FimV